MSVSKFPGLVSINIGDYVQALAASRFYPHLDGFVDRDEELKDYDGEECKMICNGWYMHNPKNWPLSEKINPLFVAFHINSLAKDKMLSPQGIAYLKKHQPIGCRDLYTYELLREKGIEAYFSACLTLTLGCQGGGEKKPRNGKIYIVDPIYNGKFSPKNILKSFVQVARNPLDILRLCRNKQLGIHRGRNLLKRLIRVALYYSEYTRVFSRDLVMRATYVLHESPYYKNGFSSDYERLDMAKRLVDMYSEAGLVITSRIHCALPSLGFGTPVIYLKSSSEPEFSTCRMGGILDFFNIVEVNNGKLKALFKADLPITASNHPKNKDNWKPYAEALCKRCRDFIGSNH